MSESVLAVCEQSDSGFDRHAVAHRLDRARVDSRGELSGRRLQQALARGPEPMFARPPHSVTESLSCCCRSLIIVGLWTADVQRLTTTLLTTAGVGAVSYQIS